MLDWATAGNNRKTNVLGAALKLMHLDIDASLTDCLGWFVLHSQQLALLNNNKYFPPDIFA